MERLLAYLLIVVLCACGPSDAPTNVADAGEGADAGASGPDAPAVTCTATASYGSLAGLASQTASGEGSAAARYNLEAQGHLNGDAAPDVLSVLLYGNAGSFGEVLSTGTIALDGIEADFSTCGACVLLDTDTQDGQVTDVYMAQSGQLELLEIGARFRAVITDAEFRHVLIDAGTLATTDHQDGCTTAIDRAEFDVEILN